MRKSHLAAITRSERPSAGAPTRRKVLGTGYLLAPDWVLTVHHVVKPEKCPDRRCDLVFPYRSGDGLPCEQRALREPVPGTIRWCDKPLGLGLIRLDTALPEEHGFRVRGNDVSVGTRWDSWGFPRLSPDYDAAHLNEQPFWGTVEGFQDQQFVLQTTEAIEDWSRMSGASVFVADRLLGMVTAGPEWSDRRLKVTPLEPVLRSETFRKLLDFTTLTESEDRLWGGLKAELTPEAEAHLFEELGLFDDTSFRDWIRRNDMLTLASLLRRAWVTDMIPAEQALALAEWGLPLCRDVLPLATEVHVNNCTGGAVPLSGGDHILVWAATGRVVGRPQPDFMRPPGDVYVVAPAQRPYSIDLDSSRLQERLLSVVMAGLALDGHKQLTLEEKRVMIRRTVLQRQSPGSLMPRVPWLVLAGFEVHLRAEARAAAGMLKDLGILTIPVGAKSTELFETLKQLLPPDE